MGDTSVLLKKNWEFVYLSLLSNLLWPGVIGAILPVDADWMAQWGGAAWGQHWARLCSSTQFLFCWEKRFWLVLTADWHGTLCQNFISPKWMVRLRRQYGWILHKYHIKSWIGIIFHTLKLLNIFMYQKINLKIKMVFWVFK